jgi:antitoxin VapB
MQTAKLFKNGQSQAVRLPKEFRFEGDEVLIKREGEAVILLPCGKYDWQAFFDRLNVSDDFMENGREQPTEQQEREELFP